MNMRELCISNWTTSRFSAFSVLLHPSTYSFSVVFVFLECFSSSGLFRFVTGKQFLFFAASVFLDCFVLFPVGTVAIFYFFVWCGFVLGCICYSSLTVKNARTLRKPFSLGFALKKKGFTNIDPEISTVFSRSTCSTNFHK